MTNREDLIEELYLDLQGNVESVNTYIESQGVFDYIYEQLSQRLFSFESLELSLPLFWKGKDPAWGGEIHIFLWRMCFLKMKVYS